MFGSHSRGSHFQVNFLYGFAAEFQITNQVNNGSPVKFGSSTSTLLSV